MKKIDLLYKPKIYFIEIQGKTYEFFSNSEFNEFLKKVDLSKYDFKAGVK